MFPAGTQFHIGGVSFSVSKSRLIGNTLELVAEMTIEEKYNHQLACAMVIEQVSQITDKMKISMIIAEWFVSSKIKLKQNISMMITCKKQLLAAELRKLHKSGETWNEIISTLAYSMFDTFWSGIVARNYRILAGNKTNDKASIYSQIKDQLVEKENLKTTTSTEIVDSGEIDL